MVFKQKRAYKITVFAHRGYSSKYPENTILAFEKAIESGADYIELDVRLSKDDEMIVMHDSNVKRMSGVNKEASKLTLDELRKLDFGMGQTICTLREVFEFCKGKIGIQVELKIKGITKRVIDLTKEFQMEKEVFISSFEHKNISETKKLYPELMAATLEPTGLAHKVSIEKAHKIYLKNAEKNNADAIHVGMNKMEEELMEMAHKEGLLVNVYTVDSPVFWEALIDMGVDGIFTNDCEGLVNYLKTL